VNDETLILAYIAAHYLPLDSERLRLRVGRRAEALEFQVPGVRQFCVITACNPASHPLTDTENALRLNDLAARIDAEGKRRMEAIGRDAERSWREASLLVFDLALDRADALAIEFGQNAILHWQRGRAVRLRLYGARWQVALRHSRVDTRFIEWVACAPR
jgi:hypothetical protein